MVETSDRPSGRRRPLIEQTELLDLAHVLVRDLDGKIVFWNRGAEQLYGWSREEALGKISHELLDTEFPVSRAEVEAAVLRDGEWQGELSHARRDGRRLHVASHWVLRRDAAGRPTSILQVNNDITERKQAEVESRRRAELLLEAQQLAHLGSWEWDIAEDRITWSEELYRIFGLEPSNFAVTYQGYLDRVHPGDRERVHGIIDASYREPRPFGFEHRIVRPDGDVRVLESRGVVDVDAWGRALRMLGTAHDVTERTRAEEVLRESNRRLEEALGELELAQERLIRQERLRALGELASGIAHDFNNALAVIGGYTELLLERPRDRSDPATLQQYLQLIAVATRDAAAVVARLRDFYRAHGEDEALVPVGLNDLIKQVIELTRPRWRDQAQAAGATIRIEMDLREIPPVAGREPQLRDALTNLILNAVDAMPDGGTLTLRTRAKGDWIELEIADTGVGMPPEVRARAFDPYFTTKGEHGSGLGLAMVHGIVARHGGTIDVESESGRGTLFAIRLRAASAEERVVNPSKVSAAPPVPLHVLVVEDDSSLRRIVRSYLQIDGHTVQTARGGREALERFGAGAFDLVLTDRAMPGVGGDELAAEVKRLSPKTPVLMMTGLGELMERAGERPDGVDLVLSKPFSLAELREALAAVWVPR